MESKLKKLGRKGRIPFPPFTGERIYMLQFSRKLGLPERYARWQPTVDAMLSELDHSNPNGCIYLMVDQAIVKAGETHRRGGPHIDGNWLPTAGSHGTGTGRHGVTNGRHGTGRHGTNNGNDWAVKNLAPEAIVLASDVTGSCAYVGEIDGDPAVGGDCSHLELSKLKRRVLRGGTAYIGNVTMIHESIPVKRNCKRTLVRLNIPGYTDL